MKTLRSSEPVARKDYSCDASEWMQHDLSSAIEGMTFTDLKVIVRARNNGWRIVKGQKHLCSTCIDCEGSIYTWRAIKEIHELCIKYDLYEYDYC